MILTWIVVALGVACLAEPWARAGGYSTDVRSPINNAASAGTVASKGQGGSVSGSQGVNPALLGGVRGYPGVKLRLNRRAFQYASTLVGSVLSSEVKRARIPPIRQCIPQVNGCILVYNLYVSRFRCPQRVSVYPSPPNRVVVSVQNLDVGVSGNLGGQVVVLLPLVLSGIVHANAHQVSITVQAALERSPSGAPSVRIVGCTASVGYVDAYIQNGGLIGDIVNNQFRAKVSEQVRALIPSKLCDALPQLINEKVNPKLRQIPQNIALTQIASLVGGIIGGQSKVPEYCSSQQCQKPKAEVTTTTPAPSLPVVPAVPAAPEAPDAPASSSGGVPSPASSQSLPSYQEGSRAKSKLRVRKRLHSVLLHSGEGGPLTHRQLLRMRSKRGAPRAAVFPLQKRAVGVPTKQRRVISGAVIHPPRDTAAPLAAAAPPPGGDPCAGCPDPDSKDPFSAVQGLLKALDISKLSDILLTTQILRAYATPNDYTLELNGEFSPRGRGGTPFAPFPMRFPQDVGNSMAEALVSDFTFNSLLYQMHKRGFISFRVGPDTPKIGDLLKTTCSDDDYSYDDSVELDEEDDDSETSTEAPSAVAVLRRSKRQDDDDDDEGGGGALADLGICIGDIMPAVREAHPNKKLNILIHTERAPSVVFSSKDGGTATLDLVADAEIFIDDTGEKVGTLQVTAVIEAAIQSKGNKIAGTAKLQKLKLVDVEKTLGLPQDALDNLANLGKDLISKMVSDALVKGFDVDIPTAGLPVTIVRPMFRIVDHAVLLSADVAVSSSLLGVDASSGGCRNQ